MNPTLRSRHVMAAASAAVLLALAGCGERPDTAETAARQDAAQARENATEARQEAAEARQETREASAEAREESRDAADSARSTAATAGEETRQAGAEVREETREATAAMGAGAREMGRETREAASDASTAVMGAARQAGDRIDDVQITTQVKTGLAVDESLKALSIDVDTKDGVVTLMGTAPSATAKTRAGEIARNVRDVKSVNNQLTVGG